jgi:hypothetical protein
MDRAAQRVASCKRSRGAWGRRHLSIDAPPPRLDVTDDGLSAAFDGHALYLHGLLPL